MWKPAKGGIGTLFFITCLVTALSCGQERELLAITVTPSSAAAKNFALGQVQFAAVASYSRSPSPAQLTSPDIVWCIGDTSGHCAGFVSTSASINASGIARCNNNFSGSVTVLAGQDSGQIPNPDIGFQLRIFGTAELTCS